MNPGIVFALCSALVWGSGDFCGGRASTRLAAFQVLALSAASGLVMLALMALAMGESVALDRSAAWAAAAGLSSGLGVVCLYRGLSIGSAATVAPLAAVLAALVPVLFGVLTQGFPGMARTAGFAVALVGIWLVARSAAGQRGSRDGLRMGALAGLGFGGFLVVIVQAGQGAVFSHLAIARVVMLGTAVGVLLARRVAFPAPASSPMALLAGVLDAAGTALYLVAQRYVRLDIAAVLSSLYPVATVLLARAVTREPVTATQWAGAAVCLAAVVLITA